MARIFVTGGSGFIGTNLVESLLASGHAVLSFDSSRPKNPTHEPVFVAGDILDRDKLIQAVKDFAPGYVVHLAARCDLDGADLKAYAANTTGVRNMIDAIRGTVGIERAIFASSRYVHPTEHQPMRDDEYAPFTFYGESKAEGEKILRASGLEVPWAMVRPTSIWGPWFGIPYRGFFDAVRKGVYVHPRGERLLKTYGYVGNVVQQIETLLLTAPVELVAGRVFYVADYEPLEVRAMAELIRGAFEASPVRDVPLGVLKTMAAAGDVLKKAGMKNPPLTSFRLGNLRMRMVYDMSPTEQVVGPQRYSLAEGVRLTADWMKQHG